MNTKNNLHKNSCVGPSFYQTIIIPRNASIKGEPWYHCTVLATTSVINFAKNTTRDLVLLPIDSWKFLIHVKTRK